MEAIFAWIKSHKVKTALIVTALFLAPLLIVHLLFKWDTHIYVIQSEWSAGDLITYISGFEAFVGTVALGALALWQNIKFKESSDSKDKLLLQIENEKIRLNYLPQFLIQTADSEKCVDIRCQLDKPLRESYIPLHKFKTYIFTIKETICEWLPSDKYPVIEKGSEAKVLSIVNCGNNTAHQVKLSIYIGNKSYSADKATSIRKDDDIFFYFSLDRKIQISEKIYFSLRFFDCFQNVYEQKFEIINKPDYIHLTSYGNVELVKRNESMDLHPTN